MGKKNTKRLALNRETLRKMIPSEMRAMAGGRTGIRMQRHRPGKNAPVLTHMCGATFGCTADCCSGCAESYGSWACGG